MDSASPMGLGRPHAPDALLLLTVIHQLGADTRADAGASAESNRGAGRRLDGEWSLIQLEHLVRTPGLLAHLLLHLVASRDDWAARRGAVSRRVRQLIELDMRPVTRRGRERRPGTLPESLDFPARAPWRRLDDVLASLAARDLLRVSLEENGGVANAVTYTLTEAGAELLESRVYPEARDAAHHLEVCGVVREFLPRWDGAWLEARLDEAAEEARAFRRDEQIPLEKPLLPELFLATFDERL